MADPDIQLDYRSMITFIKRDGNLHYLRPTPFVSMTTNVLRNEIGTFGAEYTVTVNGTIIANRGSHSGTTKDKPGPQTVAVEDRAAEIFKKQRDIRELFGHDGLKICINNALNNTTPDIFFYAKLQSLTFEAGTYHDTCKYNATFSVDRIEDGGGKLDKDSKQGDVKAGSLKNNPAGSFDQYDNSTIRTVTQLRTEQGGVVEGYDDTWSIEIDENGSITSEDDPHDIISHRGYIINRNISAKGRTYYDGGAGENNTAPNKFEAWSEAKNFISKSLLFENQDTPLNYPGYGLYKTFADKIINLGDEFRGYNHSRTETINKTAGTCNVNESWIMSSGTALENYNMSVSSDTSSAFVNVSINGSIRGLSSISASGERYGGNNQTALATPYDNAVKKYHEVSNDATFGVGCFLYKRANVAVQQNLNPQPLSISLSSDKIRGTIDYNISYDNRPTNFISEAVTENINVNDTYPGDVFATIPVIGREAGPVLQYIGSKTEYRRDVTIELRFDHSDISYDYNGDTAHIRQNMLGVKPSLKDPVRTELHNLVKGLSPLYEPKMRKCFMNPPTENWLPKEGFYSLNLSWVYELADGSNEQIATGQTGDVFNPTPVKESSYSPSTGYTSVATTPAPTSPGFIP